ncbi:MAG: aminopeptidase [Burkholderiaceae bacterium]
MSAALAVVGLAACSDTRYYLQSFNGHLQLMQSARPVEQWLEDAKTPEQLKRRLALTQRMRTFAVQELGLPDNPSYRRYADLKRRSVVWNVVAAPEFSLTLKTWCFPLLGCVGYRGYFSEADAHEEAGKLKARDLDVEVYGVPAYSTLGWMNWAGGDPLLNTFLSYPEGELARIIFHELAHQVLYVSGDTMFNESFATAVERMGGALWLQKYGSPQARSEYAEFDARRSKFRALELATRKRLNGIYEAPSATPAEREEMARQKAAALQDFREAYVRLKESWGGYAGYDKWVADANNASFGAQAAYDELVPAFEALFAQEGRQWPAFYDAVRRLARLPREQRRQALHEIVKMPEASLG